MQSSSASFRQFLRELHAEGDVLVVDTEVDPYLELAAIVRRCYELRAPAPLFTNVKGASKGGLFRILGAPVGIGRPEIRYARIAKSVGLPSTASAHEIVLHLAAARDKPPIDPVVLPSGPVKSHVLTGNEVDLESLPIPLHHMQDGGRYIQTFGMFVVQSPDGKWTNWSITRGMVCGKTKLVAPVMPKQDIGTIFQLWKDIGKDMPYALAFGVPPAAIMVSGMPIPKWTDESGYIGAITGTGVEVTKCTTNHLLVPADAEIVMEGTVSRTETAAEGPMGEYHGMTFPSDVHFQPVFSVHAITFRDDPILPLCVAGRAPEENHTVFGVMQSVELLAACRKASLPIRMAWCPFESHDSAFVLQIDQAKLVAMRTSRDPFCRLVGETVFADPKLGWYIPKLYLVGEDVDPTSLEDLFWAESTRCEPGEGGSEFFFMGLATIPMAPYIAHGHRSEGLPAKVIRCCLLPQEFTDSQVPWTAASFQGSYPPSVRAQVERKWHEYGFS